MLAKLMVWTLTIAIVITKRPRAILSQPGVQVRGVRL